jgi:polyhydroxyalkanoate synthesis regulator phasin
LINGVLVERTVKDVVPALQTNQEGLKKVLDDLVKQYKSKQDELDKWKVCCSTSFFMSQQPANLYASCQQKKNNVQVVQQ